MTYQKIPAVYISVRVTGVGKNKKGNDRVKKVVLCLTESKKVDSQILDYQNKYGVGVQPDFYKKRFGFIFRSKILDKQGKRDVMYDSHAHAKFLA